MPEQKENLGYTLSDIASLGYGTHIKYGTAVDPLVSRNDIISEKPPILTITNNITNNVYGINHRQTPLAIPMNKDHYGYTFFTRPQLNLSSQNIALARIMHKLLTTESKSWQRYIRATLDPRLQRANASAGKCELVDENMAFIPLLTNNLVSISGWKDINLNQFTSKAGQYKEEFSMVDSVSMDYSAYEITATFRNLRGDTITSMFFYWCHYMSLVFEGVLSPYPDFIFNNELDYCTRIYRIVLDPTKRKVQRIAACGAAFPTAVPIGSVFDFSNDKPYNDANAQIAVPFRCVGFICDDDILIRSFNETVGLFNQNLDVNNPRGALEATSPTSKGMVKVPADMLQYFNNRGYPYIDPITYEMCWYVDSSLYNSVKNNLENFFEYLHNAAGTMDNEIENGSNTAARIDPEGFKKETKSQTV